MDDFEKVWEQYKPMASAIIRKLHIYRDFEHFRQAAAVALWQAWERYDETKGSFTSFAYRSMYGAMLDELKRESRFAEYVFVGGEEKMQSIAAEETAIDELPEWLSGFSLTKDETALLEALFVQGRSVSELAAESPLSLAGMKKRRERLLHKIRKELEEQAMH